MATQKRAKASGRPRLTLLAQAERDMARNKALIEAGETFRSQKPSDFRRGKPAKPGRIQ